MILGLDLSLTGTGIALLTKDPVQFGPTFNSQQIIPATGNPYWLTMACLNKTPEGTYARWEFILNMVMVAARGVHTIVIEGYSFGSHMSQGRAIAELGGIVRFALIRNGHKYIEIPPTVLKKFVANAGNAKKEHMLLETFKRFKISCKTNDEADALGLAMIGRALKFGTDGLPQFQKDIIEGILHPKVKVKNGCGEWFRKRSWCRRQPNP